MTSRFKITLTAACIVFVGLLAPSASRADNLVINGNFATGNLSGWTFIPAASGSDFAVDADWGTYNGAAYAANFGATDYEYDIISQVLPTVAGTDYELSFWLQNLEGTMESDFYVSWDGTEVLDIPGTSSFGYTNYTLTLPAVGNDTLSFSGYQGPSWYSLDGVTVSGATALPEPSTYLLFGTGLAALAFLMRKKITQRATDFRSASQASTLA